MTDEEKAEFEKTKKRADAAAAELAKIKRTNLESAARVVLGSAHRFDSADTDRAIHEVALKAAKVRFDASESDERISIRFDMAVEAAREAGIKSGGSETRSDASALNAAQAGATGGADPAKDPERLKMLKRVKKIRNDANDAWKAPRVDIDDTADAE